MIWPGWTVFAKEVTDNLRDRRSVATSLLYAILGPLVLIPLLGFAGHVGDTKVLRVPVQGAELAPGLLSYLRERDIEATTPAPADPAEAVRTLACDLVIVVSPSYPADLRAGRPAMVRIVADESRESAGGEIRRVAGAIEAYSETVGVLRLMARGVSPTVISAIAIVTDDVATPESKGATLLSVVPMFLLVAIFAGGIYIAVDVTSGERERGSLEPLMATPASAAQLVLGKLGAVMFFALGTLVVTDVAFALVINFAPFPEIAGLKFRLGVGAALEILGLLVPLLLPVAATQMLLASRSRSVKEAFTAVSLCTFIPMVSGLFLTFSPYNATLSSMTIPVFAQNLLVNEVLRGGALRPVEVAVAALVTAAVGAALAALAVARCVNVRMLEGR
jgi:sodium transport system permease protein